MLQKKLQHIHVYYHSIYMYNLHCTCTCTCLFWYGWSLDQLNMVIQINLPDHSREDDNWRCAFEQASPSKCRIFFLGPTVRWMAIRTCKTTVEVSCNRRCCDIHCSTGESIFRKFAGDDHYIRVPSEWLRQMSNTSRTINCHEMEERSLLNFNGIHATPWCGYRASCWLSGRYGMSGRTPWRLWTC